MLRPLRNDIDIHFADGGQQALDLMADTPFAVVVSDMRMPGMDGAELLGKIQEMYPSTIRVMLTGQADDKSIMRTVGIVHQFLAKPCNPDKLKSVLIQSGALQEILSDGSLKDLISQIGKLPSLPTTYAKLQQAITSTDPDINEVGEDHRAGHCDECQGSSSWLTPHFLGFTTRSTARRGPSNSSAWIPSRSWFSVWKYLPK